MAICPDGKFVALDVAKDHRSFIYIVSVDTGAATRLTDAKTGVESGPAFSRDGKRIAYSYSPGNGGHARSVIAKIDGSGPNSWSTSEGNNYWPVFSPDSKTIVFLTSGYYGSYSLIAQAYPHAWNYYASNFDGTNIRRLTHESFYVASAPSVSPDGMSRVVMTKGL